MDLIFIALAAAALVAGLPLWGARVRKQDRCEFCGKARHADPSECEGPLR